MDVLSRAMAAPGIDIKVALLSMLIAFACSHALAFVYVWSHRSLSYSQSFVQALVMASVGSSMMMMVIGNNMVWGIGMVGALALVRFRTNLRDSRDMMFVFISLVIGLAAGTMAYSIAIGGTVLFCLIAMYLRKLSFGFQRYFDALLRFTISTATGTAAVQDCLKTHCSRFSLTVVQQVSQGEAMEHVYQVQFRRSDSQQSLISELEKLNGLSNLSLMLEEARIDV